MPPTDAADSTHSVSPKPPLEIVLASASPRRRQILAAMGVPFEIDVPTRQEPDPRDFPSVEQFVSHAAFRKAIEVADRRANAWILAADTVAEVDDRALGKPSDRVDAERILRSLIGRRHRTWTGMCLMRSSDRLSLSIAQFSWVTFRTVSEVELNDYLDSRAWEGKAGAYGIQHENDPFVESLEGSYSNVMGLPIEGATTLLKAMELIEAVAWTPSLSKNA